jgi:hypothetical protein
MMSDPKSQTSSAAEPERCYLCDVPLRDYTLRAGEKPPSDSKTADHVPPKGLFPSPKPDNLFTVPCCFRCNNQHSGFDERLRIVASIPFDRNQVGQQILEDKVVGGTMAKQRQRAFFASLLNSMTATAEHPSLVRVRVQANEFNDGIIRITKGLLCHLHPGVDYRKDRFDVIAIDPKPFDEQLKVMAMLKQASTFELGQRAFKCWHHVDEAKGGGAWMLVFYECFGFFVFHTNKIEQERSERGTLK